jgi:hypothetical protein
MQGSRRSFLAKVLAGLGTAGGIAIPGRALGWFRRRGCRSEGCCAPGYGGAYSGDVQLNFPPSANYWKSPGVDVHGGGGFFVWGALRNNGKMIDRVTIGDYDNGPQGQLVLRLPTANIPAGYTVFAYRFDSAPPGPGQAVNVFLQPGTIADMAVINVINENP